MPKKKSGTKTQVKASNKEWVKWFGDLKVWCLLVFGVFIVAYLSLVPKTPTGFELSDRLLVISRLGGVAPSPGYPVYELMLRLVTGLPLAGSLGVAYVGHALSAVMMAAAMAVVFVTAWRMYGVILSSEGKRFVVGFDGFERWLVSMLSVVVLGVTGMIVNYAVMVERFAMTTLLAALLTWLLVEMGGYGGAKNLKVWLATAAVLGLGIGHQWLFWLYVPLLAWTYWVNKPKFKTEQMVKVIGVLAATLVLPVWLLMAQSGQQVALVETVKIDGVKGVVEFVGERYLGDGQSRVGSLAKLASQERFQAGVGNSFRVIEMLANDLGWWIGGVLVLVLLYGYTRKRTDMFNVLVLATVILIVGPAMILDFPADKFNQRLLLGQFIPATIGLVMVMTYGYRLLVSRLGGALVVLADRKKVEGVVILILVLAPMFVIRSHWPDLMMRDLTIEHRFIEGVVERVKDGALVTCYSERSCWGLIYEQQVLGKRPDVTIVPYTYKPGLVTLTEEGLQGFDYSDYPMVLFDIVTWNLGKRPVYAIDIVADYFSVYGIDLAFVTYVPDGLFAELEKTIPEEVPVENYELSERVLEQPSRGWDFVSGKLRAEMAQRHITNGQVFMKMGLRENGVVNMNLASGMVHLFGSGETLGFEGLREAVEKIVNNEFYKPGFQGHDLDFVYDSVGDAIEAKVYGRAEEIARGAVSMDPKNIESRLLWAETLEVIGASDSAMREYGYVLQLDGENEKAQEKLGAGEELDGEGN